MTYPNQTFRNLIYKINAYSNMSNPNLLTWNMKLEPFHRVEFDYEFTFTQFGFLDKCTKFAHKTRVAELARSRPSDPIDFLNIIPFTEEAAKFLSIGICRFERWTIHSSSSSSSYYYHQHHHHHVFFQRLMRTGSFTDRLNLLREFCMVGCGEPFGPRTVNWGLLCDTLHLLALDLRTFHRCPWIHMEEGCPELIKGARGLCE